MISFGLEALPPPLVSRLEALAKEASQWEPAEVMRRYADVLRRQLETATADAAARDPTDHGLRSWHEGGTG